MSRCKKGYAPLPIQEVFGYKIIADKEENVFGEYDSEVKRIIKEEKWWAGGLGELGDRPHCRILPNEKGYCHFYDSKKDKCMLGDEKPDRCFE